MNRERYRRILTSLRRRRCRRNITFSLSNTAEWANLLSPPRCNFHNTNREESFY